MADLEWTRRGGVGGWRDAPGGSSASTHEMLFGGPVAIMAGTQADLPIGNVITGDALLDLTNPLLPLIVAEGVYALTLAVRTSSNLTDGTSYNVGFTLDSNADEQIALNLWSPPALAVGGGSQPTIVTSVTYFFNAGATIRVAVFNPDPSVDANFAVTRLFVQTLALT